MKYLRKFNERREEEDEEYVFPDKGPNNQDVSHWEIVRKDGSTYLKVSTDDDTYYTKMINQEKFDRPRYDSGEQ